MTIEIYCDGACIPNPGKGGWGMVIYRDGEEIHTAKGGIADTTNNVMELTGMISALEYARDHRDTIKCPTIFCDSKYVVKGSTEWIIGWKRNGWKTAKKKPVANRDLWGKIDSLLNRAPRLSVNIQWIKGHAGFEGNERADELSMHGAAEAAGVSIEDLVDEEARMRRRFEGAN